MAQAPCLQPGAALFESMYQLPSADFPSRFPFFLLTLVHGAYTLEAEQALKRADLDVPAWRTLALLREHGPMSVSEIALNAVTKLSTVTRTVLRMKADGLVTTDTSTADARVTVVTMTETGRRAIERADPVMQHIFARSFEGLTPTQIARLNELLGQVLENLSPLYSGVAKKRNLSARSGARPPALPAPPESAQSPVPSPSKRPRKKPTP
ncbi:MAG: MarR family transcriptional regulator [Burkholderiaceae bacterium]|nr:MarR family transcriptional regulator [Burkholderiaceae bacterium]